MSFGDLFKPIWKNSNPEVRLEHLVRISHSEKYKQGDPKVIAIIKKLSIIDNDERVVRQALSLLREPDDLKEVLLGARSASSKDFMIKEIENNFSQGDWKLNIDQLKKLLYIIKNESLIKEIILREPKLWGEGVDKINDEVILSQLFEQTIQQQNQKQTDGLIQRINSYPILKSLLKKYKSSPYPDPSLIETIQNKLMTFSEYQQDQEITEQKNKWEQLNITLDETLRELRERIHRKDFHENPSQTLDYFSQNFNILVSSPAIDEKMKQSWEDKFQELHKTYQEWDKQKSNYDRGHSLATQLIKIVEEFESILNNYNPSLLIKDFTETSIDGLIQQLHQQVEGLFSQAEELVSTIPEEIYSIPVISHSRDEFIAKKHRASLQIQEIKQGLLMQRDRYQNALHILEEFLSKLKPWQIHCEQTDNIDSLTPQLNDHRSQWDSLWHEITQEMSPTLFEEKEKEIKEIFSQCHKIINERIQRQVIEHKQLIVKLDKKVKEQTQVIAELLTQLENDPKTIPYLQEPYRDFLKTLEPHRHELNQELLGDFEKKLEGLYKKVQEIKENINREYSINLDKRMKLCSVLEEAASGDNKKKLVELVKEAQIKWHTLGPIAKKDFIEWNQKFESICQKILTENHDTLESVEEEIKHQIQLKKTLIEKVNQIHSLTSSLKTSEVEWKKFSSQINEVINQWKGIKILSDKDNRELNFDFKKQLDNFYQQRNQAFAQLKEARSQKLKQKNELLQEIRSLQSQQKESGKSTADKPRGSWPSLRKKLLNLNSRWLNIGVGFPYSENKILDQQFYTILEEFLTQHGEDVETRRQLKEKLLAELTLIEKSLSENRNPSFIQEQIKKLFGIKHEWDKIFFIFSKKSRKINNEFYAQYKKFLAEHQSVVDILHEEKKHNLEEKKNLLKQLEELIEQEPKPETTKKVIELQQKWKEIGPIPAKMYSQVDKVFHQKTSWFFKQKRDDYKKIKDSRQENYDKKQKIITQLRYLHQNINDKKDDQPIVDSVEELKMIWEMNRRLGSGEQNPIKKTRDEIRKLKELWNQVGPTFSDKKLNDEFYGLIRSIRF